MEACMRIHTKAVLCDEHDPTHEYLKRRMLSIMESVSWVCEDALEEHEWVLPLTISLKEEEVLAELGYEIEIPCVLQWRFLWFTAPSRLNGKLDGDNSRIAKYHEITNLAIEVWSIAKVLNGLSDEDWDLDKEMIGWVLGESLVLLRHLY